MSVFTGFLEHVGHLVHDSARSSELGRARHRLFLTTRFALFLATLGAWTVAAATGHHAGWWEAAAVAWMTVPALAAVHVARSGRLGQGEAACIASWCGLALTTTLGGGTSLFGGCVLLLVAPLEASFTSRRDMVNAAVAAAIVVALCLAAAQALGLLHGMVDGPANGDAVVAVPAILYLVVLARCALALYQHEQRAGAREEERYRILADTIGDLVLRCSRSGVVATAGRETQAMFGMEPRDFLGRGMFERVHVADRPAFLTAFADAAETGRTAAVRVRLRVNRDVEPDRLAEPVFRWIELRARRQDGAGDQPSGAIAGATLVAVVRDITAQMDHERAIETAKVEAERISHWKDAFLANVSHELRTPLNAIIGFSEMLASREFSPADPDKRREYAAIITTSGQHLLSVVNSLLDMSKLEAGCFELDPEPFALAPMVADCCDMVGLKAEKGGVTLVRHIAPDLGDIVGDKRACKQIVLNLLSNALKFTPPGGQVNIAARVEGATMLLSVADTGVGIAARDLDRLGDAFFQASTGLDRPYEGTGLGLSVVRGLVGLHGGTICLESAPGQGTLVNVRLPVDCRNMRSDLGATKIETIRRHGRGLNPVVLPMPVKVHKVA